MSNLAFVEHYTVEDWKQWEDDWELIYGFPYAMAPSPVYGHQFVMGKIFRQLDELLDDCSKCQPLFEMDYFIDKDTVVRPDTMVICYEPIVSIKKAPKIIFEIVSKSSKRRDEIMKKDLYFNQKIEYYILVYPDKKEAKVYKYNKEDYDFEGKFSSEIYGFKIEDCSIEFDFSKIWKR